MGNQVENIVLFALFGVLGLGAGLWLTGEISGLIFTAGRPGTPAGAIPGIALGMFSHVTDPSQAWPAQYRDRIPGPVAFYLTFFLLIALSVLAFKFIKSLIDGTRKKDANLSQWAKARDIKPLLVKGPGEPGRLVLGRTGGKMVATEARQSVIVLGPTQTGKTTGLAIPSILEWQGPVIAASVKNDLVRETYKWRRTQGEVWLFDPSRSTGYEYDEVRAGWSPISASKDWGGARKVAEWLCSSAKSDNSNLQDGDFWYSAAEKLMAPYLFAAAQGRRDMGEVVKWIDANEEAEVMGILARAGVEEAALAFAASMRRDERARSSIYTTAETILQAYGDPNVAESAVSPRIFPENLFNGGHNTLYICAPSHEQKRLQPIFTALVSQMIWQGYETAGRKNSPIDPALLLVIDEAANIAPLKDLDAIASTAAGIGIQLVTVFQDFAQIEARYSTRARTVVNNHRAKVVLSGISDPSTLEYVTKICGEEEVDNSSMSISGQGEKSITESKQQRSLASAGFLRRMRPMTGLVVYGHLSPMKITLRPWFKDKVLTSKATKGSDATRAPMQPASEITTELDLARAEAEASAAANAGAPGAAGQVPPGSAGRDPFALPDHDPFGLDDDLPLGTEIRNPFGASPTSAASSSASSPGSSAMSSPFVDDFDDDFLSDDDPYDYDGVGGFNSEKRYDP